MNLITLFVPIASILLASTAFAAPIKIPTLRICISGNGTLSAKTKCSKAEATASFNDFKSAGIQGTQGPQGPQGPAGVVNISDCRSIQNSQFTTNGTIVLTTSCNSGEYLLNYGNFADPFNSLQFVRSTRILYSGGIPYGIEVAAQTELENPPSYDVFTFYVTATCCPK